MRPLLELKKIPIFVWFVVFGYVLLQALTIDRFSFWFDESFTSELIKNDVQDVVRLTAFDVHPPLYYLILKGWSAIVGSGDVALRSLSVLFSAATIPFGYILVRRLTGSRIVAEMSAFLMAIGPFAFRYGQEARMYSLAALLIVLSTLTLVVQMQRPREGRTTGFWLIYLLLVSAAQYTHNMAGLAAIGHLLYVLNIVGFRSIRNPFSGELGDWSYSVLTSFILYLPWLPVLVGQVIGVSLGFWIPQITRATPTNTVSQLIGYVDAHGFGGSFLPLVYITTYAVILLVTAMLLRRDTRGTGLALFGSTIAAMTILLGVSSLPFVSPIYTVRYFSQYAPLFYAGLGALIGTIALKGSRLLGFSLLGLVSITMVFGLFTFVDGQGGAFGDGRAGAVAKDVLAPVYLFRELEDDEVLVADSYWGYYDAVHYLGDQRDKVFLLPEAALDAGALLIEDPAAVTYSEVTVPNADTVFFLSTRSAADSLALPDWRLPEEIMLLGDHEQVLIRYDVR